jgi:hypothetical protein
VRQLNRRSIVLGAIGAATIGTARAQALGTPSGRVILTISGNIGVRNAGDTAAFDRDMLEALGMTSITTATPWHQGRVTFEGVPMARLLAHVQARGEMLSVVALNDYATEIPIADFARFGVILALKRDGEYMPVRDRGPLFIIYPYDSNPELQSRLYYSRSAWQVARMTVR